MRMMIVESSKHQHLLVPNSVVDRQIFRHPRQRGTKFQHKLAWIVLFFLIFLSPFDGLLLAAQGISTNQSGGMGTGTVLSLILIFISIPRILRLIHISSLARIISLFGFCFLFGTFNASFQENLTLSAAVVFLLTWFGYSGTALAAASWFIELDYKQLVFCSLSISLILVSILSLVDGYGIADIPLINEVGRAYGLESELGRITGFTGPFLSRTQAATVMEGMVAFAFACAMLETKKFRRVIYLIAACASSLFMYHTGNRSFFLAIGVVILLVASVSSRRASVVIRNIFLLLIITVVGISFVVQSFPGQTAFYQARINEFVTSETLNQSDGVRIELLLFAFDYVLNYSLLGNGPLRIPVDNSYGNAHSILGSLVWSTGLVGLVWLSCLLVRLFLSFRRLQQSNYRASAIIAFAPITAHLIGGLAHASQANANLWIFLGLFIAVEYLSLHTGESENQDRLVISTN